MEELKVKHTAGPWETSFYGETTNPPTGDWDVIGPDGDMICDLKGCDNDEANALLIASAPELLEALCIAREWMGSTSTKGLREAQNLVDRVISKTEGR